MADAKLCLVDLVVTTSQLAKVVVRLYSEALTAAHLVIEYCRHLCHVG